MKAHTNLILTIESLAKSSAGGRRDFDAWAEAGYPLWDSTGTLGDQVVKDAQTGITGSAIQVWNEAIEAAAVVSEMRMEDCFYSEGRTRCADAIRALKQ